MNYQPVTAAEILTLRKALPAIVAWLRAREAISHSQFQIPNSARRAA